MPEPLSSILLKTFFTGAAAVGLSLICALVVLLLRRYFYVEHKREHTIQLTNKGNARSIYQLALESVHPAAKKLPIKYQLLQNGIPLAELPPPDQPVAPQTRHSAAKQAPSVQDLTQAEEAPKSSRPAQMSAQPGAKPGADAKKAVESAKKSGKAVASVSGQAASVLGIIGSFLPGELGKNLKAQGQAARGVQTKTNEAMQAPDANMRKIDALKKEGGKLSGKAAPQAPQMRPAGPSKASPAAKSAASAGTISTTKTAAAATSAVATSSAVSTTVAPGDAMASVPQPRQEPVQAATQPAVTPRYDYYAQTAEVAPGETLTLTLRILWKQLRTPEGSQVYILHSQQVPVEKISRTPIPPVTKQGGVYFAPLEPWRYWLPSLLYGFVSLSGLLALVGLSILIWR